ncbi:hypothetical protein RND81_12G063500 [Saponaria officinalis]|uniref:No apical meristem-associated C-terminal domain-containing protein n=1 Tax=Saponaria officinalis TaxID=3572 RepID=A0AAW1H3V1_SAPOF
MATMTLMMIVSEDGTIGTNQNKGVFWQRVFELYDLARAVNPALRPRSIGKLDNRFRRMSTIIMKWGSCYEMAGRRRASGWNEEKVVAETRVIYKKRFNLDHAWDMLKQHPKWKVFLAPFAANACKAGLVGGSFTGGENEDGTSSGKRVRLEDGEYSTPISIDGESVSTQRPDGIKAAKRNKGKKKVNNVEFDEMNTRFAMLNEATKRDLALAREKFEFKKKNAKVALQQLAYNNKREERKRKDQEIEQRKIDWQMLQQLLQAPSLPPQLEKMKHDFLNKFGGH